MSTDFILPDIGEGIVECELLEWLVDEGEHIEEDQPVAEVMTDKATVQIPAMHSGVVKKLYYRPGDIAKVHAPLFAVELPSLNVHSEEQLADGGDNQVDHIDTPNENAPRDEMSKGEDFLLPDIGEGIVECEIVKWHVNEGDQIEEDAVVVEVMTDKAVVEIPAKHAGTVVKRYYQQGEIAKVHQPLFSIRDDVSNNCDAEVNQTKNDVQGLDRTLEDSNSVDSVRENNEGHFEPVYINPDKVMASPAVRRMARERGLSLSDISGTGKKGRVLKKDINAVLQSKVECDANESANNSKQNNLPDSQQRVEGAIRTEKVKGIQAAMARQMVASVSTIPHFTVSDELQMDALIKLREKLKPQCKQRNVKLSFMPFFIKSLSLALSEFPILNAQLSEDGSELHYYADHNIGVAVDSKLGLLVPNIKRVQALSIFEIANELQTMIDLARAGQLTGDRLKGGTISISNIGVLGGITATPVINKPEAAIVALGKTQKLPRFDDNGNVIGQHIMQVNWSADHRFIDGATMVKFNNLWCDYLLDPEKMLLFLK